MFAFIVTVCAISLSVGEARKLVFKEDGKHHLREDYKRLERDMDKTALHTVKFSVQPKGMEDLERIFWDVNNPKSPNYGQFLSRSEVAEMTAHPEAENAILTYLGGLEEVQSVERSTFGEFITADAPISLWEREFGTTFHTFVHDSGAAVVRSYSYSLPEEIHSYVSTVFNTVQLPSRRQMRSSFRSYGDGLPETRKKTRRTASSDMITPAAIRSQYNVGSASGSALTTQSAFETDQDYSPKDLSTFQSLNGLADEPVFRVYGGHDNDDECDGSDGYATCGGGNLNVQYTMGIATNVPTTFWYQFSYIQDVFVEWLHDVASLAAPPLVHSVTHGTDEIEVEDGVSSEFNNYAIKLGAVGVTILVESGDNGVNSEFGRCGYWPSFPAVSPYVTVVGGTQGAEAGAGSNEVVCESNKGGVITSGGGFSSLNTQPSYQDAAVAAWRSTCDAQSTCYPYEVSGGLFYEVVNYGGRAYPDLALAAHNYQIVVGGEEYLTSSTGAATAAMAGLVSLVNSERIAAGQNPVGFMNPTLYGTSVSFTTDITEGMNACMSETYGGTCCMTWFNATAGWDPVSGLGVVDYAQFVTIFPSSRRRQLRAPSVRADSPSATVDMVWNLLGGVIEPMRRVASSWVTMLRNFL